MSERDTRTNQDIRIPTLGGLNERPSPANLRPGEFSHLEGLYPAQIGLLKRIPGKTFLASVTGRVLQIYATGNTNGDVLVQTDAPALYAFTLDELLGRASTPSLTFPPITEEETMSMAIIVQREANNTNGGSLNGQQTGSPSATANTFYGRRLTNILVNESGTVTTFTASTGGGASTSTAGQFVLSPGSYRISVQALYNLAGNTQSVSVGLYNVTSSAFEVYAGGSDPVVATAIAGSSLDNIPALIEAAITVTSSNKTYELRHQCSSGTTGSLVAFGGKPYTAATAQINSAAPTETYCFIKILKTA